MKMDLPEEETTEFGTIAARKFSQVQTGVYLEGETVTVIRRKIGLRKSGQSGEFTSFSIPEAFAVLDCLADLLQVATERTAKTNQRDDA